MIGLGIRRFARLAFVVAAMIVACGARTTATTRFVPLAEDQSQRLFNDAIRWSRANGLETGGCFDVFARVGNRVIVADAVESVRSRRPMKVILECRADQGLWHTHWMAASDTTVQCDLRNALDRALIGPGRPLGLVVCGVGRDSLIPFTYDSVMAKTTPTLHQIAPADTFYRCQDEPAVSLARPRHACNDES